MRTSYFMIDQIVRILAEVDSTQTSLTATARKYGIAEQMRYRWRPAADREDDDCYAPNKIDRWMPKQPG